MLSKEEIDALLQNPKPIVRTANEQDRKWLVDYVNAHPEQVGEELRAFVGQLTSSNIEVTDETDAYIAFSGQFKVHNQLIDSWFIRIPKKEEF